MDKDWKLIEQSINTSLIHILKEKLVSYGKSSVVNDKCTVVHGTSQLIQSSGTYAISEGISLIPLH